MKNKKKKRRALKLKKFQQAFRKMIADGKYTPERHEKLYQWCQASKLNWDKARRFVRKDAQAFLRRYAKTHSSDDVEQMRKRLLLEDMPPTTTLEAVLFTSLLLLFVWPASCFLYSMLMRMLITLLNIGSKYTAVAVYLGATVLSVVSTISLAWLFWQWKQQLVHTQQARAATASQSHVPSPKPSVVQTQPQSSTPDNSVDIRSQPDSHTPSQKPPVQTQHLSRTPAPPADKRPQQARATTQPRPQAPSQKPQHLSRTPAPPAGKRPQQARATTQPRPQAPSQKPQHLSSNSTLPVLDVRELKRFVSKLSPQDFEVWVMKILTFTGWKNVSVVGGYADRGVDGRGTYRGERCIVQCKHYKTRMVRAKEVREFVGTLYIQKAQRAIFVTSSSYSSQCYQEADGHPVELWNIDSLAHHISKTLTRQPSKPIPKNLLTGCIYYPKKPRRN